MRFMPTSITVAPGLTQSAPTISARPTAAIRTSARRQTAARSRVREWQTVTVAFGVDEQARHRPADEDRAADDDRLGALEVDPRAVEDLDHAGRRAGDEADYGLGGLEVERLADADPALREVPGVDRRQAVDVLGGGDHGEHPVLVDVSGERHLDEDPVDLGVAVEARHQVDELVLGDVGRQLVVDRADPGLLARAALAADVDVGGGVVADEHGREPGRAPPVGRPRGDDVLDAPAQCLRRSPSRRGSRRSSGRQDAF